MTPGRTARLLWNAAGFVFLALGLLGVPLPLLPTTPLLLLSAACFLRGSRTMYVWMHQNRWFGQYLTDYRAGRGIPWRVKIRAILLLWVTISLSVVFVVERLAVRVGLLALAAVITVHIALVRTRRKRGA